MVANTTIAPPTPLTWKNIQRLHADEWVVLGNPVFDGMKILHGVVLAHHTDKRIASMEGGEKRGDFKKFTLVFTGKSKPVRHIGLLKKLDPKHESETSL